MAACGRQRGHRQSRTCEGLLLKKVEGMLVNADSMLTAIAEISVALAGFTGVVSVPGKRRDHASPPEEILQQVFGAAFKFLLLSFPIGKPA